MLYYELRLALVRLQKRPIHSFFTMIALSLGIAATTASIIIYSARASEPPNAVLDTYYLRLSYDFKSDKMYDQVTFLDASNLISFDPNEIAGSFKSSLVVRPVGHSAFTSDVRVTSRAFFQLFATPFLFGASWNTEAEKGKLLQVVLSKRINDKLFGGANSTGQTILLGGALYQIVGVIGAWEPKPLFYDILNGPFQRIEDFFVPFALTEDQNFQPVGRVVCPISENRIDSLTRSECLWVQTWIRADNDAALFSKNNMLMTYLQNEQKLGRLRNTEKPSISSISEWLVEKDVVGNYARLTVAISTLLMIVAILNVAALTFGPLFAQRKQISILKAIGASSLKIYVRYLMESTILGFCAGIFGFAMGYFTVRALQTNLGNEIVPIVFDINIFLYVGFLSLVAGLLSGIYPIVVMSRTGPGRWLRDE